MTTTQPKTKKKYHTWDEVRGELSPEEESRTRRPAGGGRQRSCRLQPW